MKRLLSNLIIDIAPQQAADGVDGQRIGDVGVGHVVLNGPQVHVRQRGLNHGGHDSAHAGKRVWQCVVQHDVPRTRGLAQLHVAKEAVALCEVKRDVVNVRKDLRLKYHFDARPRVVIGILFEVVVLISFPDEVGHVVLQEGHVGQQKVVGPLGVLKVIRVSKREIKRIPSDGSVGVNLGGVKHDLSRRIVSDHIRIDGAPETIVHGMGIAVDEIDLGLWRVPVHDAEFDVELVVQEWRPTHVVDGGQLHEGLRIRNGRRPILKINGWRVIQWRIRGHILELCDIVDQVPIDVARGG